MDGHLLLLPVAVILMLLTRAPSIVAGTKSPLIGLVVPMLRVNFTFQRLGMTTGRLVELLERLLVVISSLLREMGFLVKILGLRGNSGFSLISMTRPSPVLVISRQW